MFGATPVDELKYAAAEMTQGRLDAEIAYEAEDELGELADSIREIQVTLGAYVREISETLEVIATGDLASGTSEQVSAVEELAARATEMNGQIQKFTLHS